MKYTLIYFTIALILSCILVSSNSKKLEKTTFILERQIKTARNSAEDYLYDISNLSNNAFEFLNNLGEKGVNFQTFEKIVQKVSKQKIPKDILEQKFKKYDTKGWGIMTFKDFSKFFEEFLLAEAAIDIENRKFSNETNFNYTETDYENDYSNSTYRKEKNAKKNVKADPKAKVSPKADPKAKANPKANIKKSFIEMENLIENYNESPEVKEKKNLKKNEKKVEKKTEKKVEKKNTQPENKKNVAQKTEKKNKTEEKKEKKDAELKTNIPKKAVQHRENENEEKTLHKIIPSKDYSVKNKAKRIEDLKQSGKWKSPKIMKLTYSKNKY